MRCCEACTIWSCSAIEYIRARARILVIVLYPSVFVASPNKHDPFHTGRGQTTYSGNDEIERESYIKNQRACLEENTLLKTSLGSPNRYALVHQPLFKPSSTTLPAHENNATFVLALPPTAVLPLPFRRPFFGAVVTASVSDAIACASRASTVINVFQASSSGEGEGPAFLFAGGLRSALEWRSFFAK